MLIELGDLNIHIGDGNYSSKYPKASEFISEGVPFISASDFVGRSFFEKDMKHISEELHGTLLKGHLKENDVLVVVRGNGCGKVGLVPAEYDEANINAQLALLRCDNVTVHPEYLYYMLSTPIYYNKMQALCSGSAQPQLPIGSLKKLKLEMPEYAYQEKIVSICRELDEKISINKRINNNLYQQAQAIFINIFANNSSVTPATIADVSLNVTDGVHNTVHDDPTGEYLLLSCKNIKGGSLSIGSSERTINKDTFDKLRRRTKLAKGDVLISSVGTVGELLLLNSDPYNYEFQRSVAIVKPNPQIVSSAYLFESLTYQRAELINAAHGAVQQCLFIADISGFPISIPDREDLLQFNNIVNPMFDIITANESENKLLSEMRNSLLPKLMSGEIDVSDIRF